MGWNELTPNSDLSLSPDDLTAAWIGLTRFTSIARFSDIPRDSPNCDRRIAACPGVLYMHLIQCQPFGFYPIRKGHVELHDEIHDPRLGQRDLSIRIW